MWWCAPGNRAEIAPGTSGLYYLGILGVLVSLELDHFDDFVHLGSLEVRIHFGHSWRGMPEKSLDLVE